MGSVEQGKGIQSNLLKNGNKAVENKQANIVEDVAAEGAVQIATAFFDDNIKSILFNKFEKNLSGWPLKDALYDSVRGGKRLRPFSTLLFYKFFSGQEVDVQVSKASAAIELIHCASLVFDDECDKKEERPDRKVATIRAKYSPEEALLVLSLSVLFSSELLFTASETLDELRKNKVRDLFVETISSAGNGEIFKWKFTNNKIIPSREEYWNKLVKSSGAQFFQMACETGAIFGTQDQACIKLASEIGYKLGELLQAGDDLKDLKLDMLDGFYSLAVINHFEKLKKDTAKRTFELKLKKGLTKREVDSVYQDLLASQAIEDTIKDITIKGEGVLRLLKDERLKECKEKIALESMIKYLMKRMQLG